MAKRSEIWVCSYCGPHRDSHRNWCAAGCGRDYNEMERFVPETDLNRYKKALEQIVAMNGPNPSAQRMRLLARSALSTDKGTRDG